MGCNSGNNSDYSSAILGQCSTSPDYVKDQLCAQFTVPVAGTETIYSAINESVIASFVLKNTGTVNFTVVVRNAAAATVIPALVVTPGQVIMRTVDNLGDIAITGPATGTVAARGELDIVVRYVL
ncbi:S-Ena type endospore appendage [Priestia koreensis]|uniref:Endospore appendages core domain-containing protein n=1 Tax=Priestia koreensis TaxID=284581 RepID=A0A0M0LC06_9BACI|nr:S-Ena type endospore appendage [Priestia koreensis]KOO48600.1 hypothetical protein AMD01_04225 [Priestia koreensis]MCM3005627.1 hypothetical protein [Priestia koreensis]